MLIGSNAGFSNDVPEVCERTTKLVFLGLERFATARAIRSISCVKSVLKKSFLFAGKGLLWRLPVSLPRKSVRLAAEQGVIC